MTTPLPPIPACPIGMSDAEWHARIDLAACYRLVAQRGWDDLIYTHISLRHPERDDVFLINPFGLAFGEITASNLIRIDIDGNLVGNSDHTANPTGFAIHAAVHRARSDAHCVMHLHTDAGIAVSMLQAGLLPVSQHAMRFWQNISYHDYEGLAFTRDEGDRLTASLGRNKAMILRNHGTLTCGETVAEAFVLMDTLEKACRTQLLAMSASPDLVVPDHDVLTRTLGQLTGDWEPEGVLEWPALMRSLAREDDSFMS